MPRKASEGQGKVRGFLESVQTSVREWWRNFVKWLREDDDKPKKRKVRLDDEQPPAPSGGGGWVALMQPIMYGLIGACVIVLAVLLWQTYRKRRAEEPQEAEGSVAAAPDIADEDVAAGDLPESGWMDMAGQLLAAGDRRLALRALYLASLVRLARRGLLAIARFKSNGDYRREVQRRAHALPQVADAFRQNVVFFEDAWYGQHDVTDGIVRAFVGNQERIRGGDEA